MSKLPSGTVTFLITDIVGSTALWERFPRAMGEALARHDAAMRAAIGAHRGVVYQTVGDAFHAAFSAPADAVCASVDAQRALAATDWGEVDALRVRMAIHTGDAQPLGGGYLAPAAIRATRLVRLAHGGQIILSNAAALLAGELLTEPVRLVGLGEHRLADESRPERLFQVLAPGLVETFPPIVTLADAPNNLPTEPGPLLGREREAAALVETLLRPDVRLLTLTGPGGTGKTRLAVHAGAELVERFPDGMFFISLAAVEDRTLVMPEIARSLGVGDTPHVSPGEGDAFDETLAASVGARLREKRLLLILDNFEHLIGAAPVVDRLLASSPQLKILVTSRVALHLRAEHEFPVPPLGLPERPSHLRPDVLMQYGAVALFVERAVAANPAFALTTENAAAVAAICRRLDGLPLAIELAAARIKLLTPQLLLSRLTRRLPLLTGGPRDLPARQQTLVATIAWSYDLLDGPERCLFRRLAVFSGGWTLEAAEAVGGSVEDTGGAAPFDVLDVLDSLVGKSLVRAVETETGEARFGMLETIREYAQGELLASGEDGELRRRHFDYFLTLVETAAPELDRADQRDWFERLAAEHANLRDALAWSLELPDLVGQGLRLATGLWRFWQVRGHLSEGRQWLEQLLAADRRQPGNDRVKGLLVAGNLAWRQGDYRRADELASEGLELATAVGDVACTSQAYHNLGALAWAQGDYDRAGHCFGESLRRERELGHAWGTARALNNLGAVAQGKHDLVGAWRYYEESLQVSRSLGDRRSAGYALHNLAEIAWLKGEVERAQALYSESLDLRHTLGDREGMAECLEGIAGILATHGDPSRAVRLFGAADAVRREIGAPMSPANRAIYDESVEQVRARLEPAAYDAAWRAGEAMTLDEAVADASS